MPKHRLTRAQAGLLHLEAQGLRQPPRRKAVAADIPAMIRRMGLLQIDSINVVARSPYLVLFSRLGAYDPGWLDQSLAQGQLFEYWAHEACLIPIEHYGWMRPRMLDPAGMGWKDPRPWLSQHQDAADALLAQIRAQGPVRAADFLRQAQSGAGGGWWNWKPEKKHLEALFSNGSLMVARRLNFHRVYDLAERVLPDWNDARDLAPAEHTRRALVENSCRALGLVRPGWVADYYRLKRENYQSDLFGLADEGVLIPVSVEGWDDDTYVHHSLSALLGDAENGNLSSHATRILSPFDPVVWDRRRAEELFEFEYRIECYTPAEKRRYGYFVLPILRRGRLIGRLDAKAHRAEGRFEIKALYLEPWVRISDRLCHDLKRALQALADWHATPQLSVGTAPERIVRALMADTLPTQD